MLTKAPPSFCPQRELLWQVISLCPVTRTTSSNELKGRRDSSHVSSASYFYYAVERSCPVPEPPFATWHAGDVWRRHASKGPTPAWKESCAESFWLGARMYVWSVRQPPPLLTETSDVRQTRIRLVLAAGRNAPLFSSASLVWSAGEVVRAAWPLVVPLWMARSDAARETDSSVWWNGTENMIYSLHALTPTPAEAERDPGKLGERRGGRRNWRIDRTFICNAAS